MITAPETEDFYIEVTRFRWLTTYTYFAVAKDRKTDEVVAKYNSKRGVMFAKQNVAKKAAKHYPKAPIEQFRMERIKKIFAIPIAS